MKMWYEEYGITKPFYGDEWVAIIKGDCCKQCVERYAFRHDKRKYKKRA